MDDDLDLRRFNDQCRLFPLPELVFFPHNVLPLHVFEPRYRQLTEDALAADQFVTMVRLRPPTHAGPGGLGSPPIDEVACLGRIIQHERTVDGRFFMLLVGRKRVRLLRERPSDRLYRIADAVLLEDESPDQPEEPRRSELIRLFRAAIERQGPIDEDLAGLLENAVPLDVLTDVVANALGLPPEFKQSLLAEPSAIRRADSLLTVLRKLAGAGDPPSPRGRTFPPPFSLN
ncbi:MAG: LON peptidase substrate-binding domain-containing protein [Isosphaeraceae bacterium]